MTNWKFISYNVGKYGNILATWVTVQNNLMSDMSFPLNLDINAVYLTVDDKIKLDISSYFHTNDIRI